MSWKDKALSIGDESGSAYEWWKAIGSPDYLNCEAMQLLMSKSAMKDEQRVLFSSADGGYLLEERLSPEDVRLVMLRY